MNLQESHPTKPARKPPYLPSSSLPPFCLDSFCTLEVAAVFEVLAAFVLLEAFRVDFVWCVACRVCRTAARPVSFGFRAPTLTAALRFLSCAWTAGFGCNL